MLNGRVVNVRSRRGLAGLRVEAWDKDERYDDLIASAVTDAKGSFAMRFGTSRFREHSPETKPDLYFKVWRGERLMRSTKDSVLWNVEAGQLPVVIKVGEQSPVEDPRLQMFLVRGRVLRPNGDPVVQAGVRVFDKQLRGDGIELGRERTDERGAYAVRYRPEQLRPQGKPAGDLIVRAYDRDGKEIAHSELLCHAPRDAVVDLVVGNVVLRGPSEHNVLLARVRSYAGETAIADLKREDVQFLACSAALDQRQVATLIVANRLAAKTSLPDWLFYALGRQGVELQLAAMLALTAGHLKETLDTAMGANIVASVDATTESALLERLHAALLSEAFREDPAPNVFSVAAWFEATVGSVSTDRGMQQEFYSRWLRRTTVAGFWKELGNDPRFTSGVIEDLRFTLLLGRLTGYLIPVLRQLKRLRQRQELAKPADLAKLTRPRWREMLRTAANGAELELPEEVSGTTYMERFENYISRIREAIETMLPGESLRVALLEASETPAGLQRLLRNHDSLDLHRDNIDAKLAERGEAAFEGIAQAERENVVQHAKALQRLVRLSPHPDHVRILDAAGFHSAYSIARTPKQRFNQLFAESAHGLWESLDGAYSLQAPAAEGGS